MTINRSASISWKGNAKKGKGLVTSESNALNDVEVSFTSRFEQGQGSNPEELLAAAQASCFTMMLVILLEDKKSTINVLETKATISLEQKTGTIIEANLTLYADISNIEKDVFDELVRNAGRNCPMTKLLNTKITLDYQLADTES